MRVAVSAAENQLDAPVDLRFGRCAFIAIADTESGQTEFVANPALEASDGAAIELVQYLLHEKIGALIAANPGPKASRVLQAAGVPVYSSRATVGEAIEQYRRGELEPVVLAAADSAVGLTRTSGSRSQMRHRGRR